MSSVSKPSDGADGDVVSNSLPVPYVTPYTNRTPTLGPLLVTALSGWAALMIEWGSLRFIDHAPVAIWIGSTFIAICVATVIANRDWLNFKNRRYFPTSLTVLMLIWAGVVGLAYYFDATSSHRVDPVVSSLQSELATARRERDVAIIERDAAMRGPRNAANPSTSSPSPHSLEALKVDDIEARIDAWRSVEGQMNDFLRILGEGDRIADNWKDERGSLTQAVQDFRGHVVITRNRLAALIGSNPDFSDLRIIDESVPVRLSQAIENLVQASSQLPNTSTGTDYESSIGPYIGPLRRQIAIVKQWAETAKSLAESSSSELSAQRASK